MTAKKLQLLLMELSCISNTRYTFLQLHLPNQQVPCLLFLTILSVLKFYSHWCDQNVSVNFRQYFVFSLNVQLLTFSIDNNMFFVLFSSNSSKVPYDLLMGIKCPFEVNFMSISCPRMLILSLVKLLCQLFHYVFAQQ